MAHAIFTARKQSERGNEFGKRRFGDRIYTFEKNQCPQRGGHGSVYGELEGRTRNSKKQCSSQGTKQRSFRGPSRGGTKSAKIWPRDEEPWMFVGKRSRRGRFGGSHGPQGKAGVHAQGKPACDEPHGDGGAREVEWSSDMAIDVRDRSSGVVKNRRDKYRTGVCCI